MADQTAKQQVNGALAAAQDGDFSGVTTIVAALTHADAGVRLRAAYCGQRIGPAAAVDPLSEMARRDPESDNRNQATYGLAGVGLPAAVAALIDVLADEDDSRRDDARTALYRVVGRRVLAQLADGDVRDERERDRVAEWWRTQSSRFDPARVYAMGEPASPATFIRELKASRTNLPDAYLNSLRDWTGQDFGQSPRSTVVKQWEKWWAAHRGGYEPGRRYFYGHLVPCLISCSGS